MNDASPFVERLRLEHRIEEILERNAQPVDELVELVKSLLPETDGCHMCADYEEEVLELRTELREHEDECCTLAERVKQLEARLAGKGKA